MHIDFSGKFIAYWRNKKKQKYCLIKPSDIKIKYEDHRAFMNPDNLEYQKMNKEIIDELVDVESGKVPYGKTREEYFRMKAKEVVVRVNSKQEYVLVSGLRSYITLIRSEERDIQRKMTYTYAIDQKDFLKICHDHGIEAISNQEQSILIHCYPQIWEDEYDEVLVEEKKAFIEEHGYLDPELFLFLDDYCQAEITNEDAINLRACYELGYDAVPITIRKK